MRKLLLLPSQSGYAAQKGDEQLAAQLAGGPSRRRLDFGGAVAAVDVSWNASPLQFEYLDAFYRSVTKGGVAFFLLDLVLDSWAPFEYQVRFVPGTYAVSGVRGQETTVSARLEVKPRRPDAEYDLALVDLYEVYGDDLYAFLNEFDHLVNDVMPAAIGP